MISLLISLLINSSFALDSDAISGVWNGSGTMTMKDLIVGVQTKPCSKIYLNLIQTDKQIIVKAYQASCGGIDPDFKDWVFDIKNGKVFDNEDEVGTFDGNLFLATIPNGGVTYAFNFKYEQDSTSPLLKSYYGVKNLMGVVVIEGNLRP